MGAKGWQVAPATDQSGQGRGEAGEVLLGRGPEATGQPPLLCLRSLGAGVAGGSGEGPGDCDFVAWNGQNPVRALTRLTSWHSLAAPLGTGC